MKVQQLIDHLKTLPPDLPCMLIWDEGGTYSEMQEYPKEQDIVKSNHCFSDGKDWTDDHGWGGEGRDDKYEVYERKRAVRIA